MEELNEIIAELQKASNPASLQGMQRFGIDTRHALGISIPTLRAIAKKHKNNHPLALQLWQTGIHEARILASMVDDPALVTAGQITKWVNDFNSWDLCDQVCGNLFDKTPYVITKAKQFSTSKKEFVKRAAFTLMVAYAVHNKAAKDEVFIEFLAIIEREAGDDRNFVRKAVNWALRGIGKRNATLHAHAIEAAKRIALQQTKAAKWIAADALRELNSAAVLKKHG